MKPIKYGPLTLLCPQCKAVYGQRVKHPVRCPRCGVRYDTPKEK